jgi:hypothetical protein
LGVIWVHIRTERAGDSTPLARRLYMMMKGRFWWNFAGPEPVSMFEKRPTSRRHR